MDKNIEHLTKSQIVLLTLLVAFISSIATAIITVSLVEQAPPEITQTVNRIVERTVERIVPTEQEEKPEQVREVTTVVKESDAIAGAAEKNTKHLVRLYSGQSTSTTALRGIGVIISKDGVVMTDASVATPGEKFTAMLFDGTSYPAVIAQKGEGAPEDIGFLRLQTPVGSDVVFPVPTLVNAGKLKIGQTVFTLSGKDRPLIEIGYAQALAPEADGEGIAIVETSVSSESILFGSPLFTTTGELVAVHTAAAYRKNRGGFTAFIPTALLSLVPIAPTVAASP